MKNIIEFEKCHPDAILPKYNHESDAGMDIYAVESATIHPGETVLIKTGLKSRFSSDYELQVRPRSGLSLKTKLRISNSPGTIDAGYRDEICVIAENTDLGRWVENNGVESFIKGESITIDKHDRIAQFVFAKIERPVIKEVNEINKDIDRGGGMGSSGV